jgi:hypothetical protein
MIFGEDARITYLAHKYETMTAPTCYYCDSAKTKLHSGDRAYCVTCKKTFLRDKTRYENVIDFSLNKLIYAYKCDLSKETAGRRKALLRDLQDKGFTPPGGVMPDSARFVLIGRNRPSKEEVEFYAHATERKGVYSAYSGLPVTAKLLRSMLDDFSASSEGRDGRLKGS